MSDKSLPIPHTLTLDNRQTGTITGVTDVLSFDEKEILLKTQAGTMTIRGSSLTLTRLDLEKGETDVQGSVDSIVYSKNHGDKSRSMKQVRKTIRNWW